MIAAACTIAMSACRAQAGSPYPNTSDHIHILAGDADTHADPFTLDLYWSDDDQMWEDEDGDCLYYFYGPGYNGNNTWNVTVMWELDIVDPDDGSPVDNWTEWRTENNVGTPHPTDASVSPVFTDSTDAPPETNWDGSGRETGNYPADLCEVGYDGDLSLGEGIWE
jgi:hypothetical protein